MNEECNVQIVLLNQRLTALVEMYKSLRKELEEKNEQIDELKKEIKIRDNKIKELDNNYNNLKLAQAFGSAMSESEEKDAKARLNKIIREIDNCIALLNK